MSQARFTGTCKSRTGIVLLFIIALNLFACSPQQNQTAHPFNTAALVSNTPVSQVLPTSTVTPRVTHTAFRPTTMTSKSADPTANKASTHTPTPPLTRTPQSSSKRTTPTLPASFAIKDIHGFGQLLSLTCEARAAADWAQYFGIRFRELDFFNRLPKSEDPEEGFVGSPNGAWGQIPPAPYGVHAKPIAALLRDYGAKASAVRKMTLTDLRTEISAGRPVIVWVVGHVEPGKGVKTKIDGRAVLVARYEHTVIVTGYDDETITLLDNGSTYQRKIEVFLQSWSALENMAVIWDED